MTAPDDTASTTEPPDPPWWHTWELPTPGLLSNPFSLLRVFVLVVLGLGVLGAIPGFDDTDSYTRPIVHGAFTTVFLVSVLATTLLLLKRPNADHVGTPDVIDVIVDGVRRQLRLLPLIVLGLGVLVALVDFPRSDLDSLFLRGLAELCWDLALALAAAVVVAALVTILRLRVGSSDDETLLQPATSAAAAALLRDGAIVTSLLVMAAAALRILEELDGGLDNVRGFADTFENALWFLMALVAIVTILVGFAWAIEQRHGIDDPAEATRLARKVPRTLAAFWGGAPLARQAPLTFGALALGYVILNQLARSNLGNISGLPAFDGSRQLAVLLSDILWVALFGGVLITVVAGIVLLAGSQDNVPFLSLQALYLISAAACLAAIGEYLHQGRAMGFHDAVIETLVHRWSLGACGIAGVVALRALYADLTQPRAESATTGSPEP